MWLMRNREQLVWAVLLALCVLVWPVTAQDVTDDDVNAVANQLYCPVCENIPLDACGTAACQQWRGEIRDQLVAGRTPQQVIDDFVARFGDRVVGTPVDPTLRALSLVTPWVLGAVVLLVGVVTLLRWRSRSAVTGAAPADAGIQHDDSYYRSRIEQDLQARR